MIDINLPILLAQIITFLIALFIVWKIAWGPLTKMMQTREETIKNNIDKAEQERILAEGLKNEYQEQLNNSKDEAQNIILQAMKDGHKEREEIIKIARAESEKIAVNARKELGEEKNKLVKELRGEVTKLAVEISQKLIERTIDKSVQEKVFKDVLDNIDRETPKN